MKRWIALGTVIVALAIIWFFWSPNRVPELQRVPINSQDTLVVHAFLDQPTDSIQLGRSAIIRSDESGIMIVMSFRSTNSSRDSDWSWLKCIHVPDDTGSFVSVEQASFMTIRSDGSAQLTSPSNESEPPDGVTYCCVVVPRVETDGPCQFHFIGNDDQTVATIVSPLPAPVPSEDFNQHPHQVETTSGSWKAKILGLSFWRYAKSSIQTGTVDYARTTETLWFEYNGQVMQKDEVAVIDLNYSDALGNKSTKQGLPPDLQPRWKMSMRVGRIDYMADRNASELKYLGKFDDLKSVLELSPSDHVPGLNSATCFGLGNHQISIFYKGRPGQNINNYRAGFFGHRAVVGKLPISSSSSGDRDSWKNEVTYSTSSRNDSQQVSVSYFTRASIGTKMTVNASVPLIAINLTKPLVNQFINVFAFDQLNRPLQVNSVIHTIPQMPLYIVETDTDTEYLELYSSIEDLVPLEMYFIPPTRGVEFPPAKNDFSYLSFVPIQGGWIHK